ncbi:CRISPR-associated endonuclease Cas3'' [Deinococcus wulumuqiensis]|uniref:CRISPR-associated endonuclease Cas3'' n=1 Tax=Deinococcus wulumuqiensis TaxID=980427 RepID=UPI00242C603D|nr:CRISPR-associated endonuclease Cas3'' [Deinococcus wulumuqiensis]
MSKYMGHSPSKENPTWQSLKDHVQGVTNRTEQHVRYLVPAIPHITVYARLAGLLHDLGKYRDEFQIHRLKWHPHEERHDPSFEEKSCPHSDAGARLMATEFEMDGEDRSELPFIIASHHSKLTDTAALGARLKQTEVEETHELFAKAMQDTPELQELLQDLPGLALQHTERAFLIRTLFSALVDADRLDTEGHGSPTKAAVRSEYDKQTVEMSLLLGRLQAYMQARNSGEKAGEPINALRREMYRAALSHAGDSTGFFRLTMPTGGGKTLTSLAFALAHAQVHGLRRVVYGVPFTTIIDQTAQVFRDTLEQNDFKVLEHHSNLEPKEPQTAGEEEKQTIAELATENWDAPVIVTTTVRLFQETLFGTRTAQLRRLHNLTGSVIVLDEAQTLPTGLLTPTLDALQFLVRYCGCSVVLCTATQPALDERLGFPALKDIRDLIDDADHFFEQLKRVNYQFRTTEPTSWDALALELGGLSQVLCIVNTRQHAQELFEVLGDTRANFHLSTNMVPHHRKRVLAIIRHRLMRGKPCRVISTQLIEAGVDVDFPTVYRAMGPLEAIVQAAGRCNREGNLESGQVIIFVPEDHKMPRGDYEVRESLAKTELAEGRDLNRADAFTEYFRQVYGNVSHAPEVPVFDGKKPFQDAHAALYFGQVAKAYRMIEGEMVPVIVRGYDKERVNQLLRIIQYPPNKQASREAWRALQGYTLNIYAHQAKKLLQPDETRPRILEPVPELAEWAARLDAQPLAIYQWPETARYDLKLGVVAEVEDTLMTAF